MRSRTVVSVLCPAFNNERWIEQTIQSLAAQETTFRYEILIRDDGSTDQTAQLLREARSRYPDKVRLFLNTENSYPQKNPLDELRRSAIGEFIAYCDGDDSWQDPSKLQKQYVSLINSPSAVASYHEYTIRRWVPGYASFSEQLQGVPKRYSPSQLIKGAYFPWCVLFHRAVPIMPLEPHINVFVRNQDRYFCANLGFFGWAMRTDNIEPSIHNVHQSGSFGGLPSFEKEIQQATSLIYIARNATVMGETSMARAFRNDAVATLALSLDDLGGFWSSVRLLLYLVLRKLRRRMRRLWMKTSKLLG